MCDAAEWKKSPTGLAPKPIVKNHKLRRPRRARRFPHFRSSFDPGFHCCLNSILNLRHLAHSCLLRAQRTRRRCCCSGASHYQSLFVFRAPVVKKQRV